MVPCIMELGGKCPAVIDSTADVNFAADKIAFAKFVNSGQTCVAPDYVFVHASIHDQFVEAL
jgi:aldehyde dehydrogenase (NAD+)